MTSDVLYRDELDPTDMVSLLLSAEEPDVASEAGSVVD